jgi:hypothetical protein
VDEAQNIQPMALFSQVLFFIFFNYGLSYVLEAYFFSFFFVGFFYFDHFFERKRIKITKKEERYDKICQLFR